LVKNMTKVIPFGRPAACGGSDEVVASVAARIPWASLVLKAFDDLDHAGKRELLDRKAAIEAAARERL
jgi:hypothetical protein